MQPDLPVIYHATLGVQSSANLFLHLIQSLDSTASLQATSKQPFHRCHFDNVRAYISRIICQICRRTSQVDRPHTNPPTKECLMHTSPDPTLANCPSAAPSSACNQDPLYGPLLSILQHNTQLNSLAATCQNTIPLPFYYPVAITCSNLPKYHFPPFVLQISLPLHEQLAPLCRVHNHTIA